MTHSIVYVSCISWQIHNEKYSRAISYRPPFPYGQNSACSIWRATLAVLTNLCACLWKMHLSCAVRETEEKSDANWAKQRADRRVSRWQPRLAKVRLICQQRDWQSVSVRTRPNLLPASMYTPVVWYIYDQKLESGQNYDDCRATLAYSVCSAHLANVWHNQQSCIFILWEAHLPLYILNYKHQHL